MPPPVVPDSDEPSESEEEPVVPESEPVEPELVEPEPEPVEPEDASVLAPVSVEPLLLPLDELLGSLEVESRPLLDTGGTEGPVLVLESPDSELPPLVPGGESLHAVAVTRPEATSTK